MFDINMLLWLILTILAIVSDIQMTHFFSLLSWLTGSDPRPVSLFLLLSLNPQQFLLPQ